MGLINRTVKTFFFIIIPVFFLGCSAKNITYPDVPQREIKGELAIHFFDVGQGDSTFIHTSRGDNMLIDAGSPGGGPDVVRYLKKLGVKKINHVILTHPHDDHIGGIFSILSEFQVDHFYDNGFSNFSSTMYGDYIERIRKKLSKYHILQAGERLLIGNLEIDVLNPLLPPTGNLNEDSIVLRLNFGDINVFLSGDMGQLGERRLLKHGTALASQVIKIGHHGENDVCSVDFLEEVKPDVAIISVSKMNKYARPHPELLNRLENAGVKIYRTDQRGHIVLRTKGKTYSIHTEN